MTFNFFSLQSFRRVSAGLIAPVKRCNLPPCLLSARYPTLIFPEISMLRTEKPPMGLLPRAIHDDLRSDVVIDAIIRYLLAKEKIPVKWIDEYNELLSR